MKIQITIGIIAFLLFPSLHVCGQTALRGQHHQDAKTKRVPRTSVPRIASLLGVRVGYNGQDALTNRFGEGLHTVGGHPGGRKIWYTHKPSGYIETDGFSYNDEGLALESLWWELSDHSNSKTPFVRPLPRRRLGVVYPGMMEKQVSRLIASRLPAPQRQESTWTWKAKGFVRPSPVNSDVYTTWTTRLTFKHGRLASIDVRCEGELSAL